MEKLTLDEFRARFNGRRWSDEELAETVLEHLPAYIPLVQASRDFLEACKALDAAVDAAGIRRE